MAKWWWPFGKKKDQFSKEQKEAARKALAAAAAERNAITDDLNRLLAAMGGPSTKAERTKQVAAMSGTPHAWSPMWHQTTVPTASSTVATQMKVMEEAIKDLQTESKFRKEAVDKVLDEMLARLRIAQCRIEELEDEVEALKMGVALED